MDSIIIIDSEKYFEFPNIEFSKFDYESTNIQEDLSELLESTEPGIYTIEFISYDEDNGQSDESGRWEAMPYKCITEIKLIKIGDIGSEYRTSTYYKEQEKQFLRQEAKRIQEFVSSYKGDSDYRYSLYSDWGFQLIFSKSKIENNPAKSVDHLNTYSVELTRSNLEFIEKSITSYFNTGYFEEDFANDDKQHDQAYDIFKGFKNILNREEKKEACRQSLNEIKELLNNKR